MTITRRLLLAGFAATLVVPAHAQTPPPLTVFAAASLTDAMQAVGEAYRRRTGQSVRFSFAASGTIARQIAAGARVDVFVSADEGGMAEIANGGRIAPGLRRDLLGGRLALVAPTSSRLRLAIRPGFPLARALGAGRLAIGQPASVPAGRYAQEALTRLGVWPTVAGKLAPAADVRAALTYVARGEAPLGIVYESDAVAEPAVRIVGLFPAASHTAIVYPVAVVKGAGPGAVRFYRYLAQPEARAIFRRYRFRPL